MNPLPRTGQWHVDQLQVLAQELADPQAALRFLAKYLTLLPRRIERITHGFAHHDAAGTTDALLSLKISSAMVGAGNLEAQCAHLASLPDAALLRHGSKHLPALQQAAAELHAQGVDLQRQAAQAIIRPLN
ncbi:Hpt domain-containing protein [Paenarthrobacter nicotinovorans]|uniref:Hpt domain-containing protein n=1 Tax=Paenarthrobacter nicotinovorans TaxID=29320 RepID=A0ABV0GMK6_PAENI